MEYQIKWLLIGIPAKIGFFSKYTRNIQILRSINTSFSLKPNDNHWKIILDVQEDLPQNSVLVTSFNYSSNYERSFEVNNLNYCNKIELNVYYANNENSLSSTMEICDSDKDNFMNSNFNDDEPKCLIQCFILSLESQAKLVAHLNAIGKTIVHVEDMQNIEINSRVRKPRKYFLNKICSFVFFIYQTLTFNQDLLISTSSESGHHLFS
ncbi:hypothetical protein F8M41_024622 [Gigaspora margarita]|uniref:Uncharacterized protein n=1 Tax=Gigaspora margarita TaxID=4874 RepID=A0A8H3XM33_GIGMA|nr:hypothetical protein F8M41_024622 [Gigaspora margarita]